MSALATTSEPKNLPANRAPATVLDDVRKMEKQFALALPDHVSPEKFVRVVVTAIQSNPDLKNADRLSVLGAALKCAQDGLMPDGKEAALVTYGNKAQYLPMIAGVLTKVRRSGELKTINAHVVYEKDAFTYTLGDDEKIEHQPYLEGPRGKAIAVYAVAKTKSDGIYREVMSIEEVEKVRSVSRAKNNGPWVQWWGEMARKTVLRRLAKRLPMSTDLQQVFQRDDDHYDLNKAQGAATLRRLHADFDEPVETKAAPQTINAVLEGDVIPDFAPAGEITETTTSDSGPEPSSAVEGEQGGAEASGPSVDGSLARTPSEDFPGDQPATTGPTLAEKVQAFKDRCCEASNLIKLRSIGNAAGALRKELDAKDPDLLAELDQWFEERIALVEKAEREANA